MGLLFRTESLDQVPEEFQGLYEETENGFQLVIDDVDKHFKPLDEFNTVYKSHLGSKKDFKAAREKLQGFGEHTPESIAEMQSELDELKLNLGKDANSDDDFDKKFDQKHAIKIRPLQTEIEKLKASGLEKDAIINKFQTQLTQRKLDDVIQELCADTVDPKAVIDVKFRAKAMLKHDEESGKFVTNDEYELGVEEWFAREKDKSNWSLPSGGAGATGGKGDKMTANNPFISGNLTEQAKIMESNPKEAERLQRLADAHKKAQQ